MQKACLIWREDVVRKFYDLIPVKVNLKEKLLYKDLKIFLIPGDNIFSSSIGTIFWNKVEASIFNKENWELLFGNYFSRNVYTHANHLDATGTYHHEEPLSKMFHEIKINEPSKQSWNFFKKNKDTMPIMGDNSDFKICKNNNEYTISYSILSDRLGEIISLVFDAIIDLIDEIISGLINEEITYYSSKHYQNDNKVNAIKFLSQIIKETPIIYLRSFYLSNFRLRKDIEDIKKILKEMEYKKI